MKGHIRERSPGRWAIIIDIRDPAGKRKRKWHSFRGTKREAQKECARLITEHEAGTGIDPSRETVAVFLDRWIEHMGSQQVSPRTLERPPWGEGPRRPPSRVPHRLGAASVIVSPRR